MYLIELLHVNYNIKIDFVLENAAKFFLIIQARSKTKKKIKRQPSYSIKPNIFT